MKKIFFSAEICDYTAQEIKFLSIALVKETGESLYLEIDQPIEICSGWAIGNIIPRLTHLKVSITEAQEQILDFTKNKHYHLVLTCGQYDWIGWCNFWGGSLKQPLYYTPLDLSTLIDDRGYNVGIDRYDLAKKFNKTLTAKTTALDDARLTRLLWYLLKALPNSISG